MKIKLYDEVVNAEEPEKEITLRLFRRLGKTIVGVVNDNGNLVNCGVLIEFNSDMTFRRMPCVSIALGLPLNSNRQLVEDTDD